MSIILVNVKFERSNSTPSDLVIPKGQMISTHLIKSIVKKPDKYIINIDESIDDILMYIDSDIVNKLKFLNVYAELHEGGISHLFCKDSLDNR